MLQQLHRWRLFNLVCRQRQFSGQSLKSLKRMAEKGEVMAEKGEVMAEKGEVMAEKGSEKTIGQKQRSRKKIEKIISKIDRYKMKVEKIETSNSLLAQVICSGAHGHSKCLVLRTDHERYMFNCGETAVKNFFLVQGAAHAINNIFFTYNSWSNIGGVVGAFLTMTSRTQRQTPLTFHGPPDVEKTLSMNRHFVQLEAKDKGNYIKCRSVEDGRFEDNQLSVEYVKLVNNQEQEQNNKDNRLPNENNGENVNTLAEKEKYAVAYIVTPGVLPRNVDKQKLADLNIKGGPWMKDLKNGKPVTLLDGRVINPDDILGGVPDDRQPILVFECPTQGFLDSLLTSKQILSLSEDPEKEPQLIVHMSPIDVTTDLRYKRFCDRFSSKVQHIMMNEECRLNSYPKTMQIQTALNLLQPSFFPLLTTQSTINSPVQSQTGNIINGAIDFKYLVRPLAKRGIQYSLNLSSTGEEGSLENWLQMIPDMKTQIYDLQQKMTQQMENSELKMDYPKITVLGSGSAEPNIKRNTSALLLEIRPEEYIMLDCSEGTLAQLHFLYDPATVAKILTNLKAIYISHLHYDHHGGVFNIHEARCKAQSSVNREDPLHIIAPAKYGAWVDMYHSRVNPDVSRLILHAHQDIVTGGENKEKAMEKLLPLLGCKELLLVSVNHTRESHALIVTHQDGWKLVYSGDCRPSHELAEAGKDCDILIHEATFGLEDQERAYHTKHSTTSEAIGIGKMMRAKFTLLTHYSQRMFLPTFTKDFTDDVGFVFDFMTVTPRQLGCVPLMKPLLSAMFMDNNDITGNETVDIDSEETSKKRKGSNLSLMTLGKNSDQNKTHSAKKRKKTFL